MHSQRPVRLASLELPELPLSVRPDDPALSEALTTCKSIWEEPQAHSPSELATWLEKLGSGLQGLLRILRELPPKEEGLGAVIFAISGHTLLHAAQVLSKGLDRCGNPCKGLQETQKQLEKRAQEFFGACALRALSEADPTLDVWRLHCDKAIKRVEP
ncbi:MAG: hypothetical protein RMJ84_09465 [Sandaracinaceae bacterium]|nr:hypothetical protein [Sandaracinaceae bacterium]